MNFQPTKPVPDAAQNMGRPAARYEARAKVTGEPIYAADVPVENLAHAYLLTSGIAKGRTVKIDTAAAERAGVIRIFTHETMPARKAVKHMMAGGVISDSVLPLADARVHYDGQIIAVVVAESFEAARHAAHLIEVEYEEETASADIDAAGVEVVSADADKEVGDFDKAFADAAVTVDAEYYTASQHHNAMELYSTTAVWQGDELTLFEPSQFVYGLKNSIAEQLEIAPEKVHVVNPYVGGAFGGKGVMTQRTAIIAAIARELGRPVKLVATREQGFTITTYRAETRHHVRLGADASGKLLAYGHEGFELSSRADSYKVAGTSNTIEMYACPNISTKVNVVHADRNTPGFMRSPPEMPYMYALESAMDELAEKLEIDPVELRRINDTQTSPVDGRPYSSRSLMECFDQAARSFGWEKREAKPATMRDGDWLIGYGCATAVYPTNMMPSAATVTLTPDGRAEVKVAAAEVGQGAYSVAQQVAADYLNLPMDSVSVAMGNTNLPPGPIAGGSMTTASVSAAVKMACEQIAAKFGNDMPALEDLRAAFGRIGATTISEHAEFDAGGGEKAMKSLYSGKIGGGDSEKKKLMFAFGANFVEVRVHRLTREIRVPRMTGAFASGRIINPRTTRSQYLGGMIWGMESALMEASELDKKRGRYTNSNLADYLIAVNADIPHVDIIMVPETDTDVNPLGVKGVGELGNVGMPAAIANAVHHATGKRIRDLPITVDKLLG
jgi:xanthine dehydrogenase YagR molybdenum-binding subunit